MEHIDRVTSDLGDEGARRRVEARDLNSWAERLDSESSRHVVRVPRMPLTAADVAAAKATRQGGGAYGELGVLSKAAYHLGGPFLTRSAKDAKRVEGKQEVLKHMRETACELEVVVQHCEDSLVAAMQVLDDTKEVVRSRARMPVARKKQLLRKAKVSVDAIAARRDDALDELQRFKMELIQREADERMHAARLRMAAKTSATLRKMPREDVRRHTDNINSVSDGLQDEDADRTDLAAEFGQMQFGEPRGREEGEENDYDDDADTLSLFRDCGIPDQPTATTPAYTPMDLPPVPLHVPSTGDLDLNRLLDGA